MIEQARPPKLMFRQRRACSFFPGFTILELLLVMTFIVIAFFPMLQALSRTLLVTSGSESQISAINLAQAKLEEIKSIPFSAITSEAKLAVPRFPSFQREVAVIDIQPNLKRINVRVYWAPSGGIEDQISFETYVSNF